MAAKIKKRKWIIRLGLLFIIFASVLAKPFYTLIVSRERWSINEFVDYKNLFNKDAQKNLQLFNTIENRLREPESQYIYNNSFNVFVTKIHIPDSVDLKNAIVVKNKVSNIEQGELYYPVRSFNSEINIKSGGLSLVKGIELNIDGNDVNIVNATESQASYYFESKTFSLIFNNDQIYIVAEANKPNFPVTISFIKKGNLLYVVIMTIDGNSSKMHHDQLFNILNR